MRDITVEEKDRLAELKAMEYNTLTEEEKVELKQLQKVEREAK
jgi:hypothetical protein